MTTGIASRLRALFPAVILLAGVALAQEPAKEPLGPDRWPTTVQETVGDILARMPEADRERLKATDKKDLIRYHHSWGMGIRNYYGLWRGNTKLLESACGTSCHPDTASSVIMAAVWDELHK